MSQMEKPPVKRIYFIQKGFQAKMIAKFVLLLLIMALISSLILYFLAGSELKSSYYEAHASVENMWSILGPTVLITNLVSVFIISIATVFVILYASHKIAGPLYKFEKNINEISTGNLNLHMRFRQGDQLKTLGTALENMVGKLSERIKEIKNVSNDISKTEEKLQALSGEKSISAEDIQEIQNQLKNSTLQLNSELEKFKL